MAPKLNLIPRLFHSFISKSLKRTDLHSNVTVGLFPLPFTPTVSFMTPIAVFPLFSFHLAQKFDVLANSEMQNSIYFQFWYISKSCGILDNQHDNMFDLLNYMQVFGFHFVEVLGPRCILS